MAHLIVFWIFAPMNGAKILPLGDYFWLHDHLVRLASSPTATNWHAVNVQLATVGRFFPGVLALHALALRLNALPQIAYWILAMVCVQATVAALGLLVEDLTGSSALGAACSAALFSLPHFVSTCTLSINSETIQLPFLACFLLFAYRFCFHRATSTRFLLTLTAYFGVLTCKETGVFLSLGCVGAMLVAAVNRHAAWKPAGTLALSSLLVTIEWCLWRGQYLSVQLEGYPAQIVSLNAAVAQRTVVWLTEIVVAFSPLALVLPWWVWKMAAACHSLARPSEIEKEAVVRIGFFIMPLIVFVAGMVLVNQIVIRYFVPALLLAAVPTFIALRTFRDRLVRRLGLVLLGISALNGLAGGLTARTVVAEVLRWQETAIDRIIHLPSSARVLFDAPAPLDTERYLPNITWSVHTFHAREDLSFIPFQPRKVKMATHIMVMSSYHVGLITDRYIGGSELKFDPGANSPTFEFSSHVVGWQVRGLDLLLWIRDLFQIPDKSIRHPLGLSEYVLQWRIYEL